MGTSEDDDEILARIQGGDEGAEVALFHKYHRDLIVVARATGLPLADAEDAVAPVMFRAIARARRGTLDSPAGPFLRRSARNAALDYIRKERARLRRQADVVDALLDQGTGSQEERTLIGGMTLVVRQALAEVERREDVRRGKRQAVSDVEYLMWIGGGASNADLAEWSEKTENNAKVRRHRVVKRLKDEAMNVLGRLPEGKRQELLSSIRLDENTIEALLRQLLKQG